MPRIVVFTNEKGDLESWRPWLEQDYEVTFISTSSSLLPLLLSWQPQLLIYYDKKIREPFLKTIFSQTQNLYYGFITVMPYYDLREELVAFQLGSDHFILASSPVESVRARIRSLMQKIQARATIDPALPLISLPSQTEKIQYKDIFLYPDRHVLRVKGEVVKVTPTQFRLLTAFFTHTDELLTRDWLYKYVFAGSSISPRSIDAQIAKLKRAVPLLQKDLINIYGQGYLLRAAKTDVA